MEENLQINQQEKLFIRIDELGRIHLPIQVRNKLNIYSRDKLYIYKSGKNIILEKLNFKVEKEKIFEEKKIINHEMEIHIEINKMRNSILEDKKGILRVVDELGRCVIPIEIREELNILGNDIFKIWIKDNKIILIKNRK